MGNITGIYRIEENEKIYYNRYYYDEANQLVREDNRLGEFTSTYTYDVGGNIVSRIRYPYTEGDLNGLTATESHTYSYGNAQWGDVLTGYNGQSVSYDAMGNITSFDGKTYVWTAGRQLSRVIDTENNSYVDYFYDDNGQISYFSLYENNVLSSIYQYLWEGTTLLGMRMCEYEPDENNNLIENEVIRSRIIYDADGEPLGYLLKDAEPFLYTKNILGDITGIVNGVTGQLILEYVYDAYGNMSIVTPDNSVGDALASVLVMISNPLSYRGYVFAPVSGYCHYLGSRFYVPQLCRFMNADIYADTAQGVVGTNMFAYCCNNSINMIDPSGLWAEDVHSGYYSNDKKALKIKGSNYGTYYWAKCCGFSSENAKLVAKSCFNIDKFYPAWVFSVKNQSWHFNTSKNGIDSRLVLFMTCILLSNEYAIKAQNNYNQGTTNYKVANDFGKALIYLGYALHPLQDIYSHTADVSDKKSIGTRIVFYSHLDHADVDNAEVHSDVVLGIVREQTVRVLYGFANSYRSMIKNIKGTNYQHKLQVN